MFKFLTLFFVSIFSLSLSAGPVLTVNPKRTIRILGVIDFSLLSEVAELEAMTPLVNEKKEDVFLMINSPGGMVDPGLIFTNAVDRAKQRGYQVKCFTTVIAASMAFQILAHCSEVYSLKHAKLLFHPVRISGEQGFTQADLDYYAAEIRVLEQVMNDTLQRAFRFNNDMFRYHYERETMWEAFLLARETDRIKIVSDIIGIESSYQFRKPRGLFLGYRNLQYIRPDIQELYIRLTHGEN